MLLLRPCAPVRSPQRVIQTCVAPHWHTRTDSSAHNSASPLLRVRSTSELSCTVTKFYHSRSNPARTLHSLIIHDCRVISYAEPDRRTRGHEWLGHVSCRMSPGSSIPLHLSKLNRISEDSKIVFLSWGNSSIYPMVLDLTSNTDLCLQSLRLTAIWTMGHRCMT
ncbi:hypothetical protein GALMADRAFT_1187653 [Galerina marginata CBS 339.88]|uniref:Uncharacterized protein n=1 Tax=Galerina marginata (strain CBS 339.88) TaxID=685588 RepID=A0A067TAK7_GALM3|nr:hypothetical protein GALMADRAFT_1187653 [Galerina marginata CBS 339.88]